jgi:hypothetical protein
LAAYFDRLPNGVASHPDAQLKSDAIDHMRASFPGMLDGAVVPQPLIDVFTNRQPGEWVPEVIGSSLHLACRDLAFQDDESYLDWSYESSEALFNRPLYRVVMHVMSPTLVIIGAAKRWATFHQGSKLEPSPASRENGRVTVHGVLTHPGGLFPQLVLQTFARAFEAAVAATRAQNPRATMEQRSDTETRYILSWED